MTQTSARSKNTNWKWYQFRLRTVLIIAALLLAGGVFLHKPIASYNAVAWVHDKGGNTSFIGSLQRYYLSFDLPFNMNSAYSVRFERGPELKNITPLTNLSGLTQLRIRNRRVKDFSGLTGLRKLSSLELSGTNFSDCSQLVNLKNLRDLCLAGTLVTDITPLAELPALQDLDLSKTKVTDLTPLLKMKHLEDVTLPDAFSDSDPAIIELQSKLPNLVFHNG